MMYRGNCLVCGRKNDAAVVGIPHATAAHRKASGIHGEMATAMCRDCVRCAVSAWAEHGAAGWAAWAAQRNVARGRAP